MIPNWLRRSPTAIGDEATTMRRTQRNGSGAICALHKIAQPTATFSPLSVVSSAMAQLFLIALGEVFLAAAIAAEPAPEDAKIVSEVKAVGGKVIIGTDASGNPDYLIVLSGTQLNERAVEVLKPMKAALALTGDRVSDAMLEQLSALRNLQGLALVDTGVTDRGMEHVAHLRQLRGLAFKNTGISDKGLKHIGAMTNLVDLDLWGTTVTDMGLEQLEGLSKLQSLGLRDTKVTDTGLKYLKPLVSLKHLDLSGTRVTDDGVKDLREALPNCRIERHKEDEAPSDRKDNSSTDRFTILFPIVKEGCTRE